MRPLLLSFLCFRLVYQQSTIQIPSVKITENNALRFTINETVNSTGVFLFSSDRTTIFYVKVTRPKWTEWGGWAGLLRYITLSSTADNTTANGGLKWYSGSTCPAVAVTGPDFNFTVLFAENKWTVCGPNFGYCTLDVFPAVRGPDMLDHLEITSLNVEQVTICCNVTGSCS